MDADELSRGLQYWKKLRQLGDFWCGLVWSVLLKSHTFFPSRPPATWPQHHSPTSSIYSLRLILLPPWIKCSPTELLPLAHLTQTTLAISLAESVSVYKLTCRPTIVNGYSLSGLQVNSSPLPSWLWTAQYSHLVGRANLQLWCSTVWSTLTQPLWYS